MTMSNDSAPSARSPTTCASAAPARMRCPVEETGRYSVSPSTIPRTSAARGFIAREHATVDHPDGIVAVHAKGEARSARARGDPAGMRLVRALHRAGPSHVQRPEEENDMRRLTWLFLGFC